MGSRARLLYTLPHGIEVLAEYAARGRNLYWRVRMKPHRFFPTASVSSDTILVRRNRVILASKLGRPLTRKEHAHHIDGDIENDVPWNLELLSPAEHNRHHKTGSTHLASSKRRISESLKRAYATGKRRLPIISRRDAFGRILRCK